MNNGKIKEYLDRCVLDNSMVRIYTHPHTRDVAHLDSASSAPETANYYFLSKHIGLDIDGEAILSELSKLQITDKESVHYGCMRWYREETRVIDTNGAFFVLLPIALSFRFYKERMTPSEKDIILSLLRGATAWFERACESPALYYPNKIVSDGAMLLLIGRILDDENTVKSAETFFEKWIDYTKNRGWGWGENASAVYSCIILNALNVALVSLDERTELYSGLLSLRNSLVDYMAYHDGFEFSPSIRTYNFSGNASSPRPYNFVYGGEVSTDLPTATGIARYYSESVLHELAPRHIPTPDKSPTHTERVFEDAIATTYKGKNIHLGTMSHFPVMPCSYQNNGYGLGWQSAPVSAVIRTHGCGFLRLVTESGGQRHAHPAYNKHESFLSSSLFSGDNIPLVNTYSAQSGAAAAVVRDVRGVANPASYFADEWCIPSFSGEIIQYNGWFVFVFENCAVAVCAPERELRVVREGDGVRLSQICYEGEEKLLTIREWNARWCIVALDDATDFEHQLDKYAATLTERGDRTIPRVTGNPFTLSCGEAQLDFDIQGAKVY